MLTTVEILQKFIEIQCSKMFSIFLLEKEIVHIICISYCISLQVCAFAAGASMFEASVVTGHSSGEVTGSFTPSTPTGHDEWDPQPRGPTRHYFYQFGALFVA